MVRLQGEKVMLATLEREDCKKVWEDTALQDIDWKNRACSLGYGLTKLEYRNKGYATDAVKVMLRYGFRHLGLERISSSTQESNIGSQRVLEKSGFMFEGRERKACYFAGQRHDRLIYGLLAEDYLQEENHNGG